MQKIRHFKSGFALPTVLIVSVVMLTVLTVSVSSVVAVRTALLTQYYEQLAKTAGEAGVAYAKACLAKNGNVPLWTNAKPLKPSTDCAGNTLLDPEIQVLVVGGGGGGGAGLGGGGGGGAVVENKSYAVTPGTYTVTVGAGGAGGTGYAVGGEGAPSFFNTTITANGGGGGGARSSATTAVAAGNGANGGGGSGSYDSTTGSGGRGGTGTQGTNGGMGSADTVSPMAGNGGGGGGAGGAGGAASGIVISTGISGNGGSGLASIITGNTTQYGAGGSGGRWDVGDVGTPGQTGGGKGGAGPSAAGSAGMTNTGGGGGGGSSGAGAGGSGGSGVVVVRYPTDGSVAATVTGTYDSYISGLYRVIVFKSNGTLVVSNTVTPKCPSNPRCAVTADGNVRSLFSVGLPTLSADGKAVAIPNTGVVELLRASTGEVWRTYTQPTVQAAVVPDLCSGAATSGLGWSNAVRSTPQGSLPGATSAQSISVSDTGVAAGQLYFRKDFVVNTAGTYTVLASTPNAGDKIDIYVNGALVTTAQSSVGSGTVTLGIGCHVVTAKLTNQTVVPRKTSFMASVQQTGAASPVAATDTSWRVSTGIPVDFSSSDFYADPAVWAPVYDYDAALTRQAAWSVAVDPFARVVTSNHSGCPAGNCPASSYTYLRDSRDFVVDQASIEVRLAALCDDDCTVYVDGNMVLDSSPSPTVNHQSLTLSKGPHRIGVVLKNATAGESGVAISVYDKTNSRVIARTDNRWQAASSWFNNSVAVVTPIAYEESFAPSPNEIPVTRTFDVLAVGGGGGGGGACTTCAGGAGGGGGAVALATLTPTVGTALNVTVGAGGTAGVGGATRARGGTGGTTILRVGAAGAIQLQAIGGGGGGAGGGTGGGTTAGVAGGSGGGGAGGTGLSLGGTGTAGQGSTGGSGVAASTFGSGGGGGAGGNGISGTTTAVGNGGAGYINYIKGSLSIFGSGGGAGTYGALTAGLGENLGASTVIGGNGASPTTPTTSVGVGAPGGINTGGGGGGGNGSTLGRAGGAGGSGTLIIRYVKGKIVATGGVSSDVTIGGVVYTVHVYTGSGTFTVTSTP